MEGAGGTASLRKAAAHWSLAGDKQLLDLLQNLHESIVTKCQEANSSLEEMVSTLDTASISLQNVNNRLMALSNSQFVESRVYDDDVDVTAQDSPVKEPSKPTEPASELTKLRDSLRVLESYHEPVHIVDSDSDSVSDEEEDRMVLKPKDLYASRPLPYVIGSQLWRSKWHAGLVAEESDTESETSKANPPSPSEQYSDSEPEREDPLADKPHASQRTISTNSSIGSELTIPTVGKPADIAAELARRLGGNVPHIPEPESESPPAAVAPTKVYRPQQPATATIFSDEPPPLDQYQSDQSDEPYQSDSEDDVFAELHRNRPHRQTERSGGAVVDQLFGNVAAYGRKDALDDDSDKGRQPHPRAKQTSPLFGEQQDSELFANTAKGGHQSVDTEIQPDATVKKPIGGISLFGNNQGAESIGAAILKRNQRKMSTSDEDVLEPQHISNRNDNAEKNKVTAQAGHNSEEKNQKDLINDLFSKAKKPSQENKRVEKIASVNKEKPVNRKVDLFTDNLFDDIDDIFTNVKPPVKETKESLKKSLFDDEDDDLFANVAVTTNKITSKPELKGKSIFDSDDDLFSEESLDNNAAKLNNPNKSNKTPLDVSNDSLFREVRDNINKALIKPVIDAKADHPATAIEKLTTKSIHEGNSTSMNDSETIYSKVKPVQDKSLPQGNQDKSIFDSDSDSDNDTSIRNVTQQNKLTMHQTDHVTKPPITLNEDSRIIDSSSIPYGKDNETDVTKDYLSEDDSLFKQIEKPVLAEAAIEEFSTPHNKDIDTKTNLGSQVEDNNKKIYQISTETADKNSEIETSSTLYVEDKLLSNNNENKIKNKELSNILISANVPKTQVQSPSLFDEDDLDDIFTTSLLSNKSGKNINKLENNNSDQLSELIAKKDDNVKDSNISYSKESIETNTETINESDVHIASDKSIDKIQIDNQNFNPHKSEQPALKTNKVEVSKGSKDLNQKSDTNVISKHFQESKVPLSKDENFDCSLSIAKKSMHEDMKKNKTEYDNIEGNFIQKEPLFSETKEQISGEPDIFSDIFSDIPPEFERPKEPKRSKNVNALFDDDSDDEALFFKKNEIVTDEKPDVSFTSQDDRLFHIFHDEPPAMDIDFTQKSKKTVHSNFETPSCEIYSEIIPSQREIYEQTNDKFVLGTEVQNEPGTFVDTDAVKNIDEAKKIVGKLKPMNFNINVSTLLPGASPKKTKTYEQVDGQVISTKSAEDVPKGEDPKMVKSVSFEGDPESEVLDNKLSKHRAKIQVKRRPSSRRARKEAVRKSGIDFGDDSTGNSSSTDISKKDIDKSDGLQSSSKTIRNEQYTSIQKKEDVIVDNNDIQDVEKSNSSATNHTEITVASISDVVPEKQVISKEEQKSNLFNNIRSNTPENVKDNANSPTGIISKEFSENSNLTTAFNKKPNVKSKVVYILNDEDIFTDSKPVTNFCDNTKKESENSPNLVKNKVLNIVDDDDELFKSGTSRNTHVATLGNVYKEVNLKNNEIDKFDSNEDIFKASQSKSVKNNEINSKIDSSKVEIDELEANIDKLFVKTQSTKVKSSLFDDLNDDESELFGNRKGSKNPDSSANTDGIITIIKKDLKLPKIDVKRPLFGDESDDDDLFGVRTTKKAPTQPLSKPKEVANKPTEPVFEDPLSMLTRDDDM